jgi:hypothetical protein
MTVAALLGLKNKRTLSLKRGCTMQNFFRYRIAAPRVHVRTPGSESREMRKGSQRYRDQQNGQNCDRTAAPALLAFTGKKWKKN